MLNRINTPGTALLFLLGFIWLSQYALHRQEEISGVLTPKQIHALGIISDLTPTQKDGSYANLSPKLLHALDVIASLTPAQQKAMVFFEANESVWNIADQEVK